MRTVPTNAPVISMRMSPSRLRRFFRQPYWFVLIGAAIVGLYLGTLAARDMAPELAVIVLGKAWIKTTAETRSFLMTMLSLQLTVLAIVISLNAPMIQSAANQYSPRLVPYYLRNVPYRRALPIFVLTAGYMLAAVREVGFEREDAARPRIVLSIGVTLVLASFLVLTTAMIRTYRYLRVERILGLVRESTFAAIERRTTRIRGLPLAKAGALALPGDATALVARASGYLAEVDVRGLVRIARRAGVRVRISRPVGDYFDAGEVVGWASADRGRIVTPRLTRRLAGRLTIAPVRESELDPAYGIRILSDVAARALASTDNDSYTARQALHQIRSVLRRLARTPLGDWNVVDDDGEVRVSVMAAELRELISIAVEAPLRYGAGDPEVLDGVLEIALEVGLVAPDAGARATAYQLIDRVLEDATDYGNLENGRLRRLLAEADLVRSSLLDDSPRPERHTRSDWALTASDELS
ncbi:MAG TPA: DUF2254 family protein [Polyangia bacterium]|nr:DUF2254 family protein [Polyangia bacterium]